MKRFFWGLALIFVTTSVQAGEVDVINAKASLSSSGAYRFDVTLRHADQGWKHYADKWQILTVDGKQLGERVLLHPHVNEQPFTRSLGGVRIPAGIKSVLIRGSDKVHGIGGKVIKITLPGR